MTVLLASGFFVGAVPVAPGTFGTLVAVPLWWLAGFLSPAAFFLLLLGVVILAVWVAAETEKILQVPDSGVIVIDEIVGFLVTTALLPFTWPTLIAGFLLFRFFDILKPFPVCWAEEKLAGGWGIVADDLLAGVMAHAVLRLIMLMMG
ncbi:MAG: phosphatidylglycerophosphatase A [Deltaproteobacteria bacterium]|nr:phosphatidylglycerophosphatase A [Candidatus Anaeroferrophillus wilburensis]MBN2888627.1 phosphatidylglycerophosphatase A [Deltaproteobacteria bacterium]